MILIIKTPAYQLLLVGFLIGFNSAARDADVTTGAFTSVFTDLSCDAVICLPNASCFISFPVCIFAREETEEWERCDLFINRES